MKNTNGIWTAFYMHMEKKFIEDTNKSHKVKKTVNLQSVSYSGVTVHVHALGPR